MPMDMKTLIEKTASSGGKYVSFLKIGDKIAGEVLSVVCPQAKDIKTGELQYWQEPKIEANAKWNCVITLKTDQRDPSDPEDDGSRTIWLKWWGAQRTAIQQAMNEVGAEIIEVGGYLTAEYVGDLPGVKGLSATKLYKYNYRQPPASNAMRNLPQQTSVPATPDAAYTIPQTYIPQAAAQTAAPVAPVADGGVPDLMAAFTQIKQALAAGLTPEQISLMLPTVAMATIRAVAAAPAQ